MGYEINLRVWRGDAAGGDFVNYTVPVEEGEVVLDAVHRLQATQASDLAVRWNCKAGKCGSCSAEINGKPRLMCMTRLSTFDPAETITVTPMRTFPVIRDLVTDVTFNFEKAREVPAFAPPSDNAGGKFRMAQLDVERSQEFRKCIECFLCQNTCHVVRDHDENKPAFAGPRFFIRYAELDMHPLDTVDRKQMAQEQEGLGYCNITKCCTEVCPEHIKITDNGIIPLKERVVDTKYDPILFLGSKIGMRKQDRAPVRAVEGGTSPIKHPAPPTESGEPAATAAAGAEGEAGSAFRKAALPAAGATGVAAAGVGVIAWARRRRKN
jgi:succinate dehydrogenase / fumarate reductase iron-sulfur subunit